MKPILILASLLLFAVAGPAAAAEACDPIGKVQFLCLGANAEDLVAVPNSDWVILSGELRAVNTRDLRHIDLFSAEPKFDKALYGACPGPLTGAEMTERKFRAHGINLRAGANGVHTLYVVHHPERESVEVFELDARGREPKVAWVGCVLAPQGVGGNGVAVLPGNGFAITSFINRDLGGFRGPEGQPARGKLAGGEVTGAVWEWSPANGWAKVPGSEASGPNGVEASANGKWFYIAEWGPQRIIKLSRGAATVTRQTIPVGFHPDNMRWQKDGTLTAAGQVGTVDAVLVECLGSRICGETGTSVAAIDTTALTARPLMQAYRANAVFAAGTTGLVVGQELWVGSAFSGSRVARFPLP